MERFEIVTEESRRIIIREMLNDCATVVRYQLALIFLSSLCVDLGEGDSRTDSQLIFRQVGMAEDKGTKKI